MSEDDVMTRYYDALRNLQGPRQRLCDFGIVFYAGVSDLKVINSFLAVHAQVAEDEEDPVRPGCISRIMFTYVSLVKTGICACSLITLGLVRQED